MPSTDTALLGRPLWFELMTTDPAAAEDFYKTIVGWTATPFAGAAQAYTIMGLPSGLPVAGVMPLPAEVKAPPFWSMYVGVPEIEPAASAIKARGGRECSPVIEIASVGRMQMMQDPQGAAFYIYQPGSTPQPEGDAPVGAVSWIELMTTDAAAAMTFYGETFDWKPGDAMDMGAMGKYHLFNRPHGMIGGMMNKPPQMASVPPHWQIYFRVPDIDAAVTAIKANGGQVLNGPMEVPGGDRIVNAMDPQGAAFSLHARKTA